MPTNLVTHGNAANSGGSAPSGTGHGNSEAPAPVVPFIRASGLHRESMADRSNNQLGASSTDLGTIDVPAYGYLRAIVLHVKASGGVAGANSAVADPDGPFTVLQNILFQEPDGSTILQYNDGYELYLSNKYGGYRAYNDPKTSPNFTDTDTDGNFEFVLRLPIELSARDGLGSLPNENSAAQFQVRMTIAEASRVYTTAPDTLPKVSVKMHIEAWDQPQINAGGVANETEPPAVNTTQYWSPQQYNITNGQASPRLTRMGNYVRNWIFVFRDANGDRTDDWPDPFSLYLDARPKDVITKAAWKDTIYQRYGYSGTPDTPGASDVGVWPYDFAHEFDGKVGFENRDLWLPTLGSTRVEASGNYPASGKLHVYTNDVSIAGVVFM